MSSPESALSAQPLPEREPNPFFFGRFGLRAGYGIVIILVVIVILQVLSSFVAVIATGKLQEAIAVRLAAKTHPHAAHAFTLPFVPALAISADGVMFLGLLFACWLFSRGERRPLAAYGIGRHRIADVLPGAFWGFVTLSLLIAALVGLHFLVFDHRALYGSAAVLYGAKWLFAFLLVGFSEEYTFRGYLQYTLMRGVWGLAERLSIANTRAVAFWMAACILSLLFATVHLGNGGENVFGIFQVFLAGITFAYALWRTGSLWWGIGFHMTWDWAQSFLYGVPDSGNVSIGRLFVTHPQGRSFLSGGTDGPEGSILATVALLLTIAIIRFTTRPGMQPALEQAPKSSEVPQSPLLHSPVA